MSSNTETATRERPAAKVEPDRAPARPDAQDEASAPARIYRPLADVIETPAGLSLMLEMPGARSEDAEIVLERRVLTIRAPVQATTPKGAQPAYAEYGEGGYERAFVLSEDFDPDRIEAEMRNGVLTITLPRAEESKPRKVVVKAA